MRDKVRLACQELQGARIVCALSGGGDSVALLHCLLSLREELSLQICAAHFNHCLRGAESDADEEFVRQLCKAWEVPLCVGRGDPTTRKGESLEEAARNLRYAFLNEQHGLIVTAHHADDQVETVLLNLLRGTGLKGLCAMQPRSGTLVRPMLAVTGQEIDRYLAEHQLSFREDRSNDGDDALRNRLRHHVIPLLQQENPNLAATVGRMTRLLQQDEEFLEEQTNALLEQARRPEGYHCPTLLSAPEVLRNRAIRQLLNELSKPAAFHVEQVARLLAGRRGSASVQLPDGLIARREYNTLRLVRLEPAEFDPVELHPGECVQVAGWKISMEPVQILEKKMEFALKCDMMEKTPTIRIRPRRTGDRLRLPGGEKSVKKLMIDRKIPAACRSRLPVLEDAAGVIAVCGLAMNEARSARPGEPAWILHMEKEETDSNEQT